MSIAGYAQATIYGADERLLLDHNHPREIQVQARAVAALFLRSSLRADGDSYAVAAEPLRSAWGLCPGERFETLPAAAGCTGFLITPTRLVTAGHCKDALAPCANMAWVFDYSHNYFDWNGSRVRVPKANVYTCRRVLAYRDTYSRDYAVIELDRPVEGRMPLRLSRRPAAVGDPIHALGFPLGLPMNWSPRGHVRQAHRDRPVVQIDVFEYNSGSPIVHSGTGEVLGLLIYGEDDFIPDKALGCLRSRHCPEDSCSGETILASRFLHRFAGATAKTKGHRPAQSPSSSGTDGE